MVLEHSVWPKCYKNIKWWL